MKKSHQVLKNVINKIGVKRMARELHLSTALIYKWCQERPQFDVDELASGAINPLDRIRKVYELTQEEELVSWICQMADGYFVRNPRTEKGRHDHLVVKSMQKLIREFSETLSAISESYADDKQISCAEAGKIREEWEGLKSVGEAFVRACEKGLFDRSGKPSPKTRSLISE